MSEPTTPDVPAGDDDSTPEPEAQEPEAPQDIVCYGSASLPAPGGN